MYSIADVAAMAGVSYNSMRESHLTGKIPVKAVKIGQQWRFPRHEIDRWLRGELEATANNGR